MSRIPHVHRCGARYHFRRRLHFQNVISQPVGLSLQTSDPVEARVRSAFLAARFAVVKRSLGTMIAKGRDFLTGKEIADLMRAELENELARAIATSLDDDLAAPYAANISRIVAEAYDIASRPDRPRTLYEDDREALLARGFDLVETDFVRQDLEDRCRNDELGDDDVRARLEGIGAPVNTTTIERARPLILRARADAHRRATLMFDPRVRASLDPVSTLLDAAFTAGGKSPAAPTAPIAGAPTDCPFLIYDDRRFGDVIDDVINQLSREGVWKGDTSQQRRIASTFAWITGDKPLGAYHHLDVDGFKMGLQRLPRNFYFGTRERGAMSRPFAEVAAELPALKPADYRNVKTINRDLSFMSTIAKHLAKTAWRPKVAGSKVLDFSGSTIAVRYDGTDLRPPWRRAHMEALFASPIYTGGGTALRRLHETAYPAVHHDAAYWAPLFWYYHQACREEICGLAVEDVNEGAEVPHFLIRDNFVRGKDGQRAGEKRLARRRALPLHPELLRLGFADYARAIRREGHEALFPELYVNAAKRGGAQFYNVAWCHMVDWIAERVALPVNERGKGPDIHSIRALGASFYEKDGVNEIVRADIMGHARAGTNGKHYSKRMATEGLEVVLAERLDFLMRHVPIVTAAVQPAPLNLLPLDQRSRLGSGVDRKRRRDAGRARAA